MATVPKTKPSPQSLKGGAHYHALKASANWATFRTKMADVATRSAAARAKSDRTEADDRAYDEATKQTPKGS